MPLEYRFLELQYFRITNQNSQWRSRRGYRLVDSSNTMWFPRAKIRRFRNFDIAISNDWGFLRKPWPASAQQWSTYESFLRIDAQRHKMYAHNGPVTTPIRAVKSTPVLRCNCLRCHEWLRNWYRDYGKVQTEEDWIQWPKSTILCWSCYRMQQSHVCILIVLIAVRIYRWSVCNFCCRHAFF